MFRNREIRQLAAVFFLITAAAALMAFSINTEAGILLLVFSAALGAVFLLFTKARYKRLAQISEQIDLVLHGTDRLYISEADEGELSILESEIAKMTLRIREQNAALQKEKEHLADSLVDIAHQLRTPLTSVNLTLSLLENCANESERKDLLRETEELLVRMDWLLTSLLKLARMDAGIVTFRTEQVRVKSLVDAALRPLLISMELHGIALRIDVPQDAVISGDSGWLTEGIQNVLKNCMESAGDNGRIEVVCEDNVLSTKLTIHDSGAGFQKEDIPRLFDRFYRGKNSSVAGHGIGLALCRSIIMGQGGTIAAKNHPQGGAVFTICFPK